MIKVVKFFSYDQKFVPWGYLPLPLGYIHYKIVESLNIFFSKTAWAIFTGFLRQGQICAPMYGENVEKSFSQKVLKTNGWNLQCMIKVHV